MKSLVAVTFFLAVMLSPVYLWQSGLPQVSNIFGALFIVLGLGFLRPFYIDRSSFFAAAFVVYAILVGVFAYLIFDDYRSILAVAYYLYGFLTFLVVVALFANSGIGFYYYFFYLIFASLVIQLVLVIAGVGGSFSGVRSMAFFNDPNQMANWVLWTIVMASVIGHVLWQSWLPAFLGSVLGIALVFYSASRSASVGILILFLLSSLLMLKDFFGSGAYLRIGAFKLLAFFVALSGFLYLVFWWLAQPDFIDKFEFYVSRFYEGDADDSLGARGFERLYLYSDYLIFGAGEGAFDRYHEGLTGDLEIHSTWAGLLFQYGIIGFMTFVLFLFSLYYRARFSVYFLFLLAPFAYGFFNYNLRNWYFWLGLAVVFSAWYVTRTGFASLRPR